MNGKSHKAGAVAAALLLATAWDQQDAGIHFIEIGALVAGSLATAKLPDKDRLLDDGPNHRSITHSVVFAGGAITVAAVLLSAVLPLNLAGAELGTALWWGMAVGYLSHLLLDSLTPARVFLLGKEGKRVGLGCIESGETGETTFMVASVVLSIGLAIALLLGLLGGSSDSNATSEVTGKSVAAVVAPIERSQTGDML